MKSTTPLMSSMPFPFPQAAAMMPFAPEREAMMQMMTLPPVMTICHSLSALRRPTKKLKNSST
eukprot:6189255-Ditylum_brightwellii.AAC.1